MAEIFILISIISLLAWCFLWLGWGQFWQTDQQLPVNPAISEATDHWPSLCVVIPARNEAGLLPQTLPTVLAQDYPGPFQVLLVDDHSADGTGPLARQIAQGMNLAERLRVVEAAPLQPGWTGKLWALEQGLRALPDTGADWVLFTDADIAYAPGQLRRLLGKASCDDLDLVSLMVGLRVANLWGRLLLPAFVYFFAMLYPFRRVNDPRKTSAAAAGGCLLLRGKALTGSGGLAPLAGALIDDCALARQIKNKGREGGGRIWLGLTREVRSLRPCDSLGEIWNMVARTAFVQLRYSPLLLFGTVAGMLLVYLAPAVLTAGGLAALTANPASGLAWTTTLLSMVAWLLMIRTYLPMLRWYRVSPLLAPLLPLTATLYTLMTVDSARRFWQGVGGRWKGRSYEAPEP